MRNRLKQHIIASFSGIKPESLSRIPKKVCLNWNQCKAAKSGAHGNFPKLFHFSY